MNDASTRVPDRSRVVRRTRPARAREAGAPARRVHLFTSEGPIPEAFRPAMPRASGDAKRSSTRVHRVELTTPAADPNFVQFEAPGAALLDRCHAHNLQG